MKLSPHWRAKPNKMSSESFFHINDNSQYIPNSRFRYAELVCEILNTPSLFAHVLRYYGVAEGLVPHRLYDAIFQIMSAIDMKAQELYEAGDEHGFYALFKAPESRFFLRHTSFALSKCDDDPKLLALLSPLYTDGQKKAVITQRLGVVGNETNSVQNWKRFCNLLDAFGDVFRFNILDSRLAGVPDDGIREIVKRCQVPTNGHWLCQRTKELVENVLKPRLRIRW